MEEKTGISQYMNELLDEYKQLRGKKKDSGKKPFWDVVVITTADKGQKKAYEIQLEKKHERNELPVDLPFFVISDPPGAKIGNGGSTLVVMETLHAKYGEKLFELKILVIHAGGWSQRMPSASVLGKIFTAVPYGEPIYQMLDISLALYWPFVPKMTAGVLVVSSDVILTFNLGTESDWKIAENGFTGMAHPSPIKIGNTHGVYVVQDPHKMDFTKHVVNAECLKVLQKPTDKKMIDSGAVFAESGTHTFADGCTVEGRTVYTDSNFFFGVDVMKKLLELKQELGTLTCEIDAYGDFLQALGSQANSDYITNTSNVSEMTHNLTECRLKVYNKFKDTGIHLIVMNASKFNHIGTAKEYQEHYCEDEDFKNEMRFKSDVFNNWSEVVDPNDNKKQKFEMQLPSNSCVMHSTLPNTSKVSYNSIVEYCHFEVPCKIGKYSIVSNCQVLSEFCIDLQIVKIPSNIFMHTIPITTETSSKFVTVFFNVDDNLKKAVPVSDLMHLSIMNSDLKTLSKRWGLDSLQSASKNGVCSLWNVQLFPAADTMSESFLTSLNMVACIYDKTKTFSLTKDRYDLYAFSDLLKFKNVTAMLKYREVLYKIIQS